MPNRSKMKLRNMLKIFRYFCLFSMLLLTSICVTAQITAETRNGQPTEKEEYPKSIQESLAKQKIKKGKQEYDEMIERGEEALKLSEQLANSYDKNKQLSKSDFEKLDRLEKLLKKIRKELGGDDDDEDEAEDKPSNLGDAVKNLRDNTVNLFDALQKTTRYSISAVAIQSSNTVLKIVKFMRFWKN